MMTSWERKRERLQAFNSLTATVEGPTVTTLQLHASKVTIMSLLSPRNAAGAGCSRFLQHALQMQSSYAGVRLLLQKKKTKM